MSTVTKSSTTRFEELTSPPNSRGTLPSRFHRRPVVTTLSHRPTMGMRPHVGPSPTRQVVRWWFPSSSSDDKGEISPGNVIRISLFVGDSGSTKAHVCSSYTARIVRWNAPLFPHTNNAFTTPIS